MSETRRNLRLSAERAEQIYAYVERFCRERGYSPTAQEIRQALRIGTDATVHKYLDRLVRLKRLVQEPGKGRDDPARGAHLPALRRRPRQARLGGLGMRCRVCGCTETSPCITSQGPCTWVEPGLCNACWDPEIEVYQPMCGWRGLAIYHPGVQDLVPVDHPVWAEGLDLGL